MKDESLENRVKLACKYIQSSQSSMLVQLGIKMYGARGMSWNIVHKFRYDGSISSFKVGNLEVCSSSIDQTIGDTTLVLQTEHFYTEEQFFQMTLVHGVQFTYEEYLALLELQQFVVHDKEDDEIYS